MILEFYNPPVLVEQAVSLNFLRRIHNHFAFWSWRKWHSLAIGKCRAFPSLQRRPNTSWIGGSCWIWSLRLKAPGLWHGRMFLETRKHRKLSYEENWDFMSRIIGQNPWCFLLSAMEGCRLGWIYLSKVFSDGRLQPGTVSFNAIVTAYGRLSEWQRSLDVAWPYKTKNFDAVMLAHHRT